MLDIQYSGAVRSMPVGAEVVPEGVHFRVWAPERRTVEVVFERVEPAAVELAREVGGCFSGLVKAVRPGQCYSYRLDGDPNETFPDPVSRFQPHGPFGPSQVVDPAAFAWSDAAWPGVAAAGHVIYELHVGTFTREGTWRAAQEQLGELAELGITLIEVMPVADFAGDFGWGYDGVNLFAPCRLYGSPDDFRSFVDRAHAAGMGVILDVVYNHFGSFGNFQPRFSRYYHSDRHRGEWGAAVNFDGENSAPVREFVLANVRYWIDEFHVDGYRVDATQAFHDDSPRHILRELTAAARRAAGDKSIFLLAENEPQDVDLVRPSQEKGLGFDALWNDDLHHTAVVRLTGRREGYYSDYYGTPEEFVAAAKWGFLYQGQRYPWQHQNRGTATVGLSGAAFVNYLENHDQVANSARGERLWQQTSPGRHRAATAFLLLAPGTPLVFQGQEFSSSHHFRYFCDCLPEQAEAVVQGRATFLAQFASLAVSPMRDRLYNPVERACFEGSKLDFCERLTHAASYKLHRDLIWLRRRDAVFSRQGSEAMHGARLSNDAFFLRHFGGADGDRLLIVNFAATLVFESAPQPLLAPPPGCSWRLLWSSDHPDYGGNGTPEVVTDQRWYIPGETAVVLTGAGREP